MWGKVAYSLISSYWKYIFVIDLVNLLLTVYFKHFIFHIFLACFQDLNVKRSLNMFGPQKRGKDEDPIIPFGDGPIISKWGAISRSARTGYNNTDPVQATASQGSATKPISVTG